MRRFSPVAMLLCLLAPRPSEATTRHVFVTSTEGTGKLSTWAEAQGTGLSGLQAGDKICQVRAEAAGLAAAGSPQFVAWLSDATDDAYCRVHGLTGKKVTEKCHLLTLPTSAGPWEISTSSLPFGGTITEMLYPNFEVFYPLYWNENDNPLGGSIEFWTGTDFNGGLDYANCGDWDSESGSPTQGTSGSALRTGFGWTYVGATDCNQDRHLVCFEVGAGTALPPIEHWGRLAFVSASHGNGELSSWLPADPPPPTGVAAGDAICQQDATAAGLPNPESFKAWLSDDVTSAKARFQYDGPWIRLDRVSIASTKNDLTDGNLDSALNLTSDGKYLSYVNVWTGTQQNGTAYTDRCDEWVTGTSGSLGKSGVSYSWVFDWTNLYPSLSCDSDARLYCLQDLPMIFADGFESGDPFTWSSVTG